jgi:hypothetical protein
MLWLLRRHLHREFTIIDRSRVRGLGRRRRRSGACRQ